MREHCVSCLSPFSASVMAMRAFQNIMFAFDVGMVSTNEKYDFDKV